MFDALCYGAVVEETEEDQDPDDFEDFLAFSIESLEGFAILDVGATQTVFGLFHFHDLLNNCFDQLRCVLQRFSLQSLTRMMMKKASGTQQI